jgi:hypothetical protein
MAPLVMGGFRSSAVGRLVAHKFSTSSLEWLPGSKGSSADKDEVLSSQHGRVGEDTGLVFEGVNNKPLESS